MDARAILRLERFNYAIGGVMCIAAALTRNQAEALGVAVGVALTCLNFFLLRRLVTRWTSDAAAGREYSNRMLLILPKMLLIMGAVVASLALLPISPVAFAIGYSVFLASIIVEVTWSAFQPPQRHPSDSDPGPDHPDRGAGPDQP